MCVQPNNDTSLSEANTFYTKKVITSGAHGAKNLLMGVGTAHALEINVLQLIPSPNEEDD